MIKLKHPYTVIQSLYRRKLPDLYIRLGSQEGKRIFKEALIYGTMESYFPLAEQFITQSEPETCGPTSLVMVLNSLNIDPGKQWKGIWRWYTQDNLNMITKQILKQGIDLQSWTHIAQHNHLDVMTFYHPLGHGPPEQDKHSCDIHRRWVYRTARYDTFRDCVLSTSRRDGFVLTLNHSRKSMGQTGDGHFSPVGGYHKQRNLALMLDVARYKYPTYWCDNLKLFESLSDTDKSTNKPRGFVLISRKVQSMSEICRVSADFHYINLFNQALSGVHSDSNKQTDYHKAFMKGYLNMFTHQLRSLLVYYLFQFQCCHCSSGEKEALLETIRSEKLFGEIKNLEWGEGNSQNFSKLQSLVNDFTFGSFHEAAFIMLISLPKSLFDYPIKEKSVYQKHIQLFRKCLAIHEHQTKNSGPP